MPAVIGSTPKKNVCMFFLDFESSFSKDWIICLCRINIVWRCFPWVIYMSTPDLPFYLLPFSSVFSRYTVHSSTVICFPLKHHTYLNLNYKNISVFQKYVILYLTQGNLSLDNMFKCLTYSHVFTGWKSEATIFSFEPSVTFTCQSTDTSLGKLLSFMWPA